MKNASHVSPEQVERLHGQIYWDPSSLGADDLTLLVTSSVDGITSIAVKKGTNHVVKERWPELQELKRSTWEGGLQGWVPLNEERLLSAHKLTGGEVRLMCKLVAGYK